ERPPDPHVRPALPQPQRTADAPQCALPRLDVRQALVTQAFLRHLEMKPQLLVELALDAITLHEKPEPSKKCVHREPSPSPGGEGALRLVAPQRGHRIDPQRA